MTIGCHILTMDEMTAYCQGVTHSDDTFLPPAPCLTLQDAVNVMNPTSRYLLADMQISHEAIPAIILSIQQGGARLVSDGSFYKTTKQAAFHAIPGLSLIAAICSHANLTAGRIIVGCDGKSALDKALDRRWMVKTSDKDHDILSLIQEVCLPIQITLQKHWIKGHQDKHVPYRRLDRMAQLNVLCDAQAKHRAVLPLPADHVTSVSGKRWEVRLRNSRLVNSIGPAIRKSVHDSPLRELK